MDLPRFENLFNLNQLRTSAVYAHISICVHQQYSNFHMYDTSTFSVNPPHVFWARRHRIIRWSIIPTIWAHPHLRMNSTQYFILPDCRVEAAPCVSHILIPSMDSCPMGLRHVICRPSMRTSRSSIIALVTYSHIAMNLIPGNRL